MAGIYRHPCGYTRGVRSRALIASSACIAVAAALGVGCGSSSTTVIPSREITFPVLWAGSNPDGTPAAGIEPATIAVGTEGDAGFTMNLEDIKAKKAGPQWLAATASAAAVGTLLAGADQSAVDLRYDITGAIDGPSGGAALTVGTMAAITGAPVKPKVAMTGTISPDGTVGTVAQVPAKVRAAKKAGYELVLVPWGNRTEFDPQSGKDVSLPALGRSLGIEVRVVRSVAEAYAAFTGTTVIPPPKAKPVITPQAQQVAQRTTRRAVAALRREFDAGDNLLTARERATIAPDVAAAEDALAAGRTALAYGLCVHATYEVKRALAAGASRALARARGVAVARAALLDESKTLLAVADREMQAQSDPNGLTQGQQLALPMALGWYAYSQAVLKAFIAELGPGSTWNGPALERAAAVIGDIEASLRRFGPDAVAVVRASHGGAQGTPERTAAFLSGYSNFLRRAGDANRDYYVTVAYGSLDAKGSPNDIVPVLRASSEIAAAIPSGDDALQDEIVQAAGATTYYVLGASVVSGASFGLQGFGLGEDPSAITAPTLLASSVQQSSETVRWVASALQPKGVNLSYALWQRQWADAVYAAFAGTPTGPAAGTIALNELWYAAAGALLANSAQANLQEAPGG